MKHIRLSSLELKEIRRLSKLFQKIQENDNDRLIGLTDVEQAEYDSLKSIVSVYLPIDVS